MNNENLIKETEKTFFCLLQAFYQDEDKKHIAIQIMDEWIKTEQKDRPACLLRILKEHVSMDNPELNEFFYILLKIQNLLDEVKEKIDNKKKISEHFVKVDIKPKNIAEEVEPLLQKLTALDEKIGFAIKDGTGVSELGEELTNLFWNEFARIQCIITVFTEFGVSKNAIFTQLEKIKEQVKKSDAPERCNIVDF